MQVKDIMTASPTCCAPSDTLQAVAAIMRDNDCGAVPVVDGDRVVGIITDRDLAIRAVAEGKAADSSIDSVLTRNPRCCKDTDDVKDVGKVMADNQVRRVPIINASGKVVGIVSQADLARASNRIVSEHEVAIVVERISAPTGNQGAPASNLM